MVGERDRKSGSHRLVVDVGSETFVSRACREGVDMDFCRVPRPGNGGARVGHGVSGTYLPYEFLPEASPPCQDTPSSGDRFFVKAPNMFFIVAPIEFLGLSPSPSARAAGLASRHF